MFAVQIVREQTNNKLGEKRENLLKFVVLGRELRYHLFIRWVSRGPEKYDPQYGLILFYVSRSPV